MASPLGNTPQIFYYMGSDSPASQYFSVPFAKTVEKTFYRKSMKITQGSQEIQKDHSDLTYECITSLQCYL